MRILVIYDSQYGNTEQIARTVAAAWREAGEVQIIKADRARPFHLSEADLLAIGGPTQGHGLSSTMRGLVEHLPEGALEGVAAVAFDTRFRYPAWLTGSAAGKLAKALEGAGCTLVAPAESFFVARSEGPLEAGEVERAEAWARLAVQKVAASRFAST